MSNAPLLNPDLARRLADHLLTWYTRHQRDLPWRLPQSIETESGERARNPFRTWVAEIMLQQTQVATVIPYYTRFLARFSTVEALAAASIDEVLKLWEGLGYYARARNLYAAAQKVVDEFDGRIPDTLDALLSLPGIGRYTAGAILSIAYGQDVPAPDGNVRRVLARLFAISEDVSRGAGQRRIWALAESMLPPGQAGDFNQALMDLGATVCTPRAPACELCPFANDCQAHQSGQEEQYPVRRPRRPTPHYQVTAGVIWNGDGRFLIAQRRLEDMLGGLWEFPGGKQEPDETLVDCLRRELCEELDIHVSVGAPLTVVRHAYTHFRITLHAFHCEIVSGQPQTLGCADWRWITLDDVDRFAFSVADRKIIAALEDAAPSH